MLYAIYILMCFYLLTFPYYNFLWFQTHISTTVFIGFLFWEIYTLSFCMVFGSSQRIDNMIFRLRSKRNNERETKIPSVMLIDLNFYIHTSKCIYIISWIKKKKKFFVWYFRFSVAVLPKPKNISIHTYIDHREEYSKKKIYPLCAFDIVVCYL